jgi:hypothetical protein
VVLPKNAPHRLEASATEPTITVRRASPSRPVATPVPFTGSQAMNLSTSSLY